MIEYRLSQIIQVCFVLWIIFIGVLILNDRDEFRKEIYTNTKIHNIEKTETGEQITWSGYDEKNKIVIKNKVSNLCSDDHFHYKGKVIRLKELESGVVIGNKCGKILIFTIISFVLGFISLLTTQYRTLYSTPVKDALKINLWKAEFYGDILIFLGHNQKEVEELVQRKKESITRDSKYYNYWRVLTYKEIKEKY